MDIHATNLYNLWQKQRRLRVGLSILCALICLSVFLLYPRVFPPDTTPNQLGNSSGQHDSNQTYSSFTSAKPTYTTLTPEHKQVDWQRSVLPSGGEAYVYADIVNGVSITVTEQPLPPSFSADTTQLEQLARGYHATRFLTIDGVKVYIGTPLKGVQAVLFSKSNLLVLIKSSDVLNDEQWHTYIASLK